MERQGKQLEQAMREKEKPNISKKWTRREEADFFRVVSSYGINYYRKKKAFDWIKFKQLAKLEKKTDEDLTEYYKNFVIMCKKQTGVKLDDEHYDTSIEHITEEKARRTLDRLDLLSRIREEVITHPKLDDRLKVCVSSADMPDWWVAGKHDKDLLLGVGKHGLGRTDYYILNDPDLSFQEILRKRVNTESEKGDNKDAIKLESREDLLKFDKNEILVKLEKGEGTLKIEKVAHKKEEERYEKVKEAEENKVELTLVKSESEPEKELEKEIPEVKEEIKEKLPEDEAITENKDDEKMDTSEKDVKEEINVVDQANNEDKEKCDTEETKDVSSEEIKKENEEVPMVESQVEKSEDEIAGDNSESKDTDIKDEKDKADKKLESIKEEIKTEEPESAKEASKDTKDKPKEKDGVDNDLCSKQAAELKAMFPDLEVIQPLSRLSQIDTFVLRDKQGSGALDFSETTVAQLFNNAVKWPKEYAIQVRLQHIIYAIETKEWPATKSFSAYASGIGNEYDIPIHELPNDPPKRDSSTPMSIGDSEVITITTDSLNRGSNKKRKRHIAIDVETERAKLHALLNSTHGLANPMGKHGSWDEDSEDSRRSTPVNQSMLQPPPAHQHASKVNTMPFDLKYNPPLSKTTIGQTTVIPGTSSTLTPIDLSSGLPKMNTLDIPKVSNQDIQNEVQDFSMPSKKQSSKPGGNKLDDTLSKLMKRKNCPEPEPVVGKEKKRRKLDEIVLGLSAAKEQSLFTDTSKKPTVTPSVTVIPTSAPVSSAHSQSQKPFSITVTSVPSSAPSTSRSSLQNMMSLSGSGKDSFSTFLAQAEQQNLLLKKQQQQRKSYEAMIADINKVADFSSKVNSYSHEAKVNKWLAEQNPALAEQPLGADYLAPRRRRPRVDPSLLDWKKLTGDENVSVINRVTGKKLTGPKAPTLKRLGTWLMENPMYDIDPKWAELVKERGNLSQDLHKRVPGGSKKPSSTPGRPPVLSSPTGSTSSVSSANLATSMASSLSFPSLGGTNLSGLNSSLLSGLSGLGQFDPKNPLLMPFAGMPNMSALSSMGGLGNLTNMNLFANLAGLGIPGLTGMDAAAMANETTKTSTSKSSTTSSLKSKPTDAHSSSKTPSSSASNIPTSNAFPFFFPNPGLLYTPLGLGGLNPFSLQPGMSAYDSLAQQCGLLNGSLNPAASPNSSSKSKSSSRAQTTTTPATATQSSPSTKSRSSREAQIQQLLLPPDTHLLESISKAAGNIDSSLKQGKSEKKDDKRKAYESLRGMLPPEFMNPEKLRDKKIPGSLADFSKLLEQANPTSSKKSQEQQMKEAIEQFSKSNAEFLARAMTEEQPKPSQKRPRESEAPENLAVEEKPAKKPKEAPPPTPAVVDSGGVDIETLLPPSTVVKATTTPNAEIESKEEKEPVLTEPEPDPPAVSEMAPPEIVNDHVNEEIQEAPKKSVKRTRGKRKSGDIPIDPESVREKKNLRSSASRSAAAAQARAERAEREKQLEEEAQRAQKDE